MAVALIWTNWNLTASCSDVQNSVASHCDVREYCDLPTIGAQNTLIRRGVCWHFKLKHLGITEYQPPEKSNLDDTLVPPLFSQNSVIVLRSTNAITTSPRIIQIKEFIKRIADQEKSNNNNNRKVSIAKKKKNLKLATTTKPQQN